MKGGDHHYSRACCSNCANAPYLLSFTFPPLSFSMFLIFSSPDYIMIQSHFCKNLEGVTVPVVSPPHHPPPLYLSCFWIVWGFTVPTASGLVMGLQRLL